MWPSSMRGRITRFGATPIGGSAAKSSTCRTGSPAKSRIPRVAGMLGYAYAVAGKTAEARKLPKELVAVPKPRFGDAFAMARIHAALGENDQAFQWLQKADDERDSAVRWVKVDPTLESLRADARF